MFDETDIREKLIASCHSSVEAQAFFKAHLEDAELLKMLVSIAQDDRGGDAPMQAAYWVSEYPSHLLQPYEPVFYQLLPLADWAFGHIALALGKTRSVRGRNLILAQLGNGERFDAWLYEKALAYYGEQEHSDG